MEFHGALGDVEFAGDFLVGEIFQQGVQNFLLAAAEIGDGFGLEATALAGEDGINEAREYGTWHPKTTLRNQRKRAGKLVASFGVREDALHAETEKRIGVGVVDVVTDHDESSIGNAFENIGEQSASRLTCGVGVNDIDLRLGGLEVAKIGSEGGLELLGDDLELRGLAKKAFKFGKHQRVRGQKTDSEFRRHSFSSHCT